MRVYGETNFLLELAFDQAEARACEELLNLTETGLLRLVVPAFSIFEARQTMFRRHAERRSMHSRVEEELTQLARSAAQAGFADAARKAMALFVVTIEADTNRLDAAHRTIQKYGERIALDANVDDAARAIESDVGLKSADALVLASVMAHLEANPPDDCCFLNRNWKDRGSRRYGQTGGQGLQAVWQLRRR